MPLGYEISTPANYFNEIQTMPAHTYFDKSPFIHDSAVV